jgi:hypothetical protein
MKTVKRYFQQGTPGVDADPNAPTQGLTVAEFVYAPDTDTWVKVMRDVNGDPYFGYLAKEITASEANTWIARMVGAAANPTDGFKDGGETWYPGDIGAGRSVVNQEGHNAQLARAEAFIAAKAGAAKQAQSLTPRQAREWLIRNDLDEALEAGILAIAESGEPEAVKQSKLMWNWYEYSTEWQYKNEHLTAACYALGIDKDQFFAEAKLL